MAGVMTSPFRPNSPGGARARRLAAMVGPGVRFVRAPGRVNLMGDHTDYNEGYVLPAAIDRDCLVAYAPSAAGRMRLESLEFPGQTLDIASDGSDEPASVEPRWGRLVAGVVRRLAERDLVATGLVGAVGSSVPVGAGLSSSAALEVGIALAILDIAGRSLPKLDIAFVCREAEEMATGVPCGVMDQIASLEGASDHALLIDCRSYTVEKIPLPFGLAIVAVHSGVSRALSDTGYAERRATCARIAARLGLASLRDASLQDVMDEPLARHVVSENLRVLVTARALRKFESSTLSSMFADSHSSLRDDYRVSTPELDTLVSALADAGAIGARLTGAGFGGCAVALVEEGQESQIADRALVSYRDSTGLEPTLYRIRASRGAGKVAASAVR